VRLNELVGVKKLQNFRTDELVDFLDLYTPYKQSGRGNFSRVFEKDGEIYKFWALDPAYERFVKYCLANKGNKHLPRFLSDVKTLTAFHTRHRDHPRKLKYVKMEILEPSEIKDAFFKTINDYLFGRPRRVSADILRTREEVYQEYEKLYGNKYQSFLETVLDVCDHVRKGASSTFYPDIRSVNVMERDGVLVLTDPGYDERETYDWGDITSLEVRNPDERVSGPKRDKKTFKGTP